MSTIRGQFSRLYGKLEEVLGNSDAAMLCFDYFIVAQFWDDLIDRDKEYSDTDINDTFYTCLVSIPTNIFYIKNSYKITPILELSIYKWFKANDYESKKIELSKAYMLRAGLYDLFALCLIIIYGVDTKKNIYDLYGEVFEEYSKEVIDA